LADSEHKFALSHIPPSTATLPSTAMGNNSRLQSRK
jgi:hypothetical protein